MCMSLAYPRDRSLSNPGEYRWEYKWGSLPLGSVNVRTIFQSEENGVGKIYRVKPLFNKTLYNELVSITNDFLYPV